MSSETSSAYNTCLTGFDDRTSFHSAKNSFTEPEERLENLPLNEITAIPVQEKVYDWLFQDEDITVHDNPNSSALNRFIKCLTPPKYKYGLAVKNAFLIGANALSILIFRTMPIISRQVIFQLLIELPITIIAGLITSLLGIGIISTILAIGLFLTILKLPVHIYNKIKDIEPKPPTSTAMKVYNYFTSFLHTAAYKTHFNIKEEVLIPLKLLLGVLILPLTNKLK